MRWARRRADRERKKRRNDRTEFVVKIFLAGASGVIGRSLVPRLSGAGHDVTGMTSDAAAADLVRSLGARPAVTGWRR